MSQILFDQYKEALRKGHVAAFQGRLEAAVTAYEAAASIAPGRALPHASLGDVLRRLGRHHESERAYDAALQCAPGDEAALRGRAAARLEVGRALDAAGDLEALSDALERTGRVPEACDAACAALEIAESRNRRRTVERLAQVLAGLKEDPVAADALERAAKYLEPSPVVGENGAASDAADTQAIVASVAFDPVAARIEAETLMASGGTAGARSLLLSIAAAERESGRLDAALDACLILMTIDPADSEVQLEMAANQIVRGWTELAREKVALLTRLAELDENAVVGATIRGFANDQGFTSPAGSTNSGSVVED